MSAYGRAATVAAYQTAATHGRVAAANPHGLIMMLFDGALERIAKARGCIQHNAMEEKNRLLHSAVAIVDELRASLNFEAGGELARNLEDLYDYICRQLVIANLNSRIDKLDEVANLLGEIRAAWNALPQEARTMAPGAR